MAWRDSRSSRTQLLLYMASIITGIAALVAINSFSNNLQGDIERQARNLLGADLVIRANKPYSDSLQMLMDSIGGERARETSFASMVYFPRTQGTRLIQVRALKGGYPFYGQLTTEPASAASEFQQGKTALVDQSLLLQFGVSVGDSVKIGRETFLILGKLIQIPGQNAVSSTVAPSVYIPRDYLPATGLLQKGSRINQAFYYKLPEGVDGEELEDRLEDRFRRESLRMETVEDRKRSVSRSFSRLKEFLNLVSFVALLLGCVGVASAVHIYMRKKISSVAILRCLGASGQQAFLIFLTQIAAMGLLGSLLGAGIGVIVQRVLPAVLMEFLPFEATLSISWPAIAQGILTGMGISVLFALLVLLPIRHVSPLHALRASFDALPGRRDSWQWVVIGIIALFVWGFAFWQMGEALNALFFSLGMGAAFLLLVGVSMLVVWAVKRYFPSRAGYLWRQSLANLFRPNNQTTILMVCIGLGTALITQLFFVQGLLLNQIELTGGDQQPNMVLFDIQSRQKEEVAQMAQAYDLPLMQQVPVVTMRLASVNGVSREEILADSNRTIRRWALNREYRATYRAELIESETLVAGEWRGEVTPSRDTIFVSLEAEFAREDLNVDIGDQLVFDVQGRRMEVVVGSLRDIDFARFQTNFILLFPQGALESAPQFHVLVTRTDSVQRSAEFQRAVVQAFPNVSVIDLSLVLNTVEDILGKVSFVIRFMASFSILTGLIVLLGSIALSRYQRIQESVLLRTLGASRRQILLINLYEYLILGLLASLTGIVIALLGTWAMAIFTFELVFVPSWVPPLAVVAFITGSTALLGLVNSLGVINNPPLEVLRKEA